FGLATEQTLVSKPKSTTAPPPPTNETPRKGKGKAKGKGKGLDEAGTIAGDDDDAEACERTRGVGTLLYIAPEVVSKSGVKDYDAAVDIYACGIIFFEMLCSFNSQKDRVAAIRSLREIPAVFPQGFEQSHPHRASLIREMMHPDASKRPSAKQV